MQKLGDSLPCFELRSVEARIEDAAEVGSSTVWPWWDPNIRQLGQIKTLQTSQKASFVLAWSEQYPMSRSSRCRLSLLLWVEAMSVINRDYYAEYLELLSLLEES